MKKHLISLLAFLMSCSWLQAFPPAPYYTIYGMVRDQVGQTPDVSGATLLLLRDGQEIGRTTIVVGLDLDQNYELTIRIDQNRTGTALYTDRAIASQGLYSLAVEMNGVLFYPIEVSGSLTAGKGGERVRLDLNLGADSDGDGLPDIWEQWQLYQAGYYPDGNGNWALHLINKHGDLDHDGFTNWQEYVAGTFAGDATERFGLEIKEKSTTSVRFEFYSITGKTYTIERSADLKTWSPVAFAVGQATAQAAIFRADDVGIVSAFTSPGTGRAEEFYRLTVR